MPENRRFHRAYWLAANDKPLGGLLNRAYDTDSQKLHRQLKDAGVVFDESVLNDGKWKSSMVINGDEEGYAPENSGIDNSEDDAREAWMNVEAEVGIAPDF